MGRRDADGGQGANALRGHDGEVPVLSEWRKAGGSSQLASQINHPLGRLTDKNEDLQMKAVVDTFSLLHTRADS